MKIQCKCKGCTKRTVGCHSTCEDYKDFCEQQKKIRERDAKERYLNLQLIDMKKQSKKKSKRR